MAEEERICVCGGYSRMVPRDELTLGEIDRLVIHGEISPKEAEELLRRAGQFARPG